MSVGFAIYTQFFPFDPDIRVAAWRVMPLRRPHLLGLGDGDAVAIGDDYPMAADSGFDASEQEIVVAAASAQEQRNREA
jgi:hypothetical protein